MTKIIIILILLPFVALNIGGCKQNILTRQQIIEIANKEAKAYGHKIKDDIICFDSDNKKWEKQLTYIKTRNPIMTEKLKILENKDYQAIQYSPKKMMLGGLLWVFIDRKTGQVITTYGEK